MGEHVNNGQLKWVNCAKAMAILAVMVDHTRGYLYENKDVAYASYYSVSLFILISGMTSYLSDQRHRESWWQTFIRSSKKLVNAYCIAGAVCLVWLTKSFDLLTYMNGLIHFNILSLHYFVFLYIQLMLVNRFLFNFLQKCPRSPKGYAQEGLMLVGLMALSSWTTNYTNILDIGGGGGKLLGGTYLFVYYIGMALMKHGWLCDSSIWKELILGAASAGLWVVLWRYMCENGNALDAYVPFGNGFNPPSVSFILFALFMCGVCFSAFTLLSKVRATAWIADGMNWIGKHTMSIFLYHLLLLSQVCTPVLLILPVSNIWLSRLVCFGGMIVGSIFIQYTVNGAIKLLKILYEPVPQKVGKNHSQNGCEV